MEHNKEKRARLPTELEQFDDLFPELVEALVASDLKCPDIADAFKWFKSAIEYNVPHGKKNRGLFVVMAYKYLVESPTEADLRLARILGWCIEFLQAFFLVADDVMDQSSMRRGQPCWYKKLQAFFLVADDVMDQSSMRRGQPCWYKKDNVGLEAINDTIFLEACIYKLLKKYIRDKPYYVLVLELFHEITHHTSAGQCLDVTIAPPEGVVDFTNYTMEKYRAIVKWKTAYYSFYLPIAIAMYMAGITDEDNHACAKNILLKIGEYFQIQDDYLDSFGDPDVIGKIGTDIQDNKCSWLVVTALQHAAPEQLKILKENYGSWDEDKVNKVKDLYKQLDLEKTFREYEESSYTEILTLIESHCGSLPKDMFKTIVNKIYKRNR